MIRLTSYVRVPRDAHRRKITRRAVFARDDWTCQYCGARSNLTVDHVIPRSKGGPSSWENIVASCAPCNRRKGDRTPAQADMHPSPGAAHARTPRSSSACRARRSRRPGGPTCRRPRSAVHARGGDPRRRRSATAAGALTGIRALWTRAAGACAAGARRAARGRVGARGAASQGRRRASAIRRRAPDGCPSRHGMCWTKPHRHPRVPEREPCRRDEVRRPVRRWSGLDSARRVQPTAPT